MPTRQDRSQFGRRQTHLQAWLLVSGRSRIPCQIRNYSQKGAFIEIEVPSWLPFRFQLRIEGISDVLTCEIRHVTSHGIGVNFCADGFSATIGTVGAADVEIASWIGSPVRLNSRGGSR
jgi:hypothetical protein